LSAHLHAAAAARAGGGSWQKVGPFSFVLKPVLVFFDDDCVRVVCENLIRM
jgi:hypothetical protein